MLAGEIICRLTEVDGLAESKSTLLHWEGSARKFTHREAGAFPEFVKRLRESVAYADVVQGRGTALGESGEEGGHAGYIADFDVVGEQRGGGQVGVCDAGHGVG